VGKVYSTPDTCPDLTTRPLLRLSFSVPVDRLLDPSFSFRSLIFLPLDSSVELFEAFGRIQYLVDSVDSFLEVKLGVDVPFKVGFDLAERLEVALNLIEIRKGGLQLVELRSVSDKIRIRLGIGFAGVGV